MSPFKTGLVVVLLCLSACGRQVVEFKNGEGDAGTDGPTDGQIDAAPDAGIDANPGIAPAVISTIPVNGGVSVSFDTVIRATFSKPMNDTTLTSLTFLVKRGATPVLGAVTFNSATSTATFTPAARLMNNQLYTATITTGARDTGGLALAANYVWSFRTAVNALPPRVISTTPLSLATGVSVNKRPTATFSKAMDPATINPLTFTLAQGLTPITGTVTIDGLTNTATFAPTMPLGIGLLYTATITNSVRDTGGLAMVANYTWSFTTSACGLAPINLRSADNFVVLAGSTVTSTGPTSVTGDLGVSPGTAITGFPPGILVGSQHAGDPTSAQGIADLTTAYNDAAGRSLCAITIAGDLGGLTLPPGLYNSKSSIEVNLADLTLDAGGDEDAIWIFQIASTLTTSPGRQVILAGGAKSANIYWQVGTSATFGTTTAFQGTVMADQAITLNTGASLDGRALARIAAVNLDSNTIVKPAP
jgi:hypothetical protein